MHKRPKELRRSLRSFIEALEMKLVAFSVIQRKGNEKILNFTDNKVKK